MTLFAFAATPKSGPASSSHAPSSVNDTRNQEKAPESGEVASTTCPDGAALPPGADAAANASASHRMSPLAEAAQGLPNRLDALGGAIEQLPRGPRKDEIRKQAIKAIELAVVAQQAAHEVERIDEAIHTALPLAVPEKTLATLRERLDESLQEISDAMDALVELDAAVEEHCADFPSTGTVVRAAIATAAVALLALALILVCPPVTLAVCTVVPVAGIVGLARLAKQYSDRVDRRADCWSAGRAASDHLAAIANKASALREWQPAAIEIQGETLVSLNHAIPERAAYLEGALQRHLECGATGEARSRWREQALHQFKADFERHLAEPLYPYTVGGKPLLHPDAIVRDNDGGISPETMQALHDHALLHLRAAAGDDPDRLDMLTVLLSQRPINDLDEVAKAALAHAGRHPEDGAAGTLNGEKRREVRIDIDSNGVATGGTIFYQESQPLTTTSRASPMVLIARNGRDLIPLPDDAALIAKASFTLEGRHIRIESVSVSVSPSVLEAYCKS